MRSSVVAFLILVASAAVGCGGSDTSTPDSAAAEGNGSAPGDTGSPPVEQIFDREFLFAGAAPDSLVHIPWFFQARVRPDGVRREIHAWLAREGGWEALAHEESGGPFARAPWRILPGEHVRLTVGEGDRIDAIRLRDPGREVETRIGEFITDWTRPGSDPARLFAGEALFPSGRVRGFVLEVNRRWESPGEAPGDWVFLHGGGLFQLFLEELAPLGNPRSPGNYRGWSRIAFQNALWNEIEVSWEEFRPFEPARRDIPHAWVLNTEGGEVTGLLQAVSSHLTAGEGASPILPLSGFFEVQGEVTVRGEIFSVNGVVRHRQY
ncbi:MAG: hypothetical protein WEG36_08025 [Gemmatimonadota bacterium]